jgi:predicted ATP-grasp superfamily ATP-dependent carboligase
MNLTKNNPAIVFNCHYNGLSIIQELGRHGIPVIALDTSRSVGSFSRYAKFIQCQDPLDDEKGVVDLLLKMGKSFEQSPVLFPTNDLWAITLAKNRELLEEYYLPCVAELPTTKMLIHKEEFYPWAQERGYPVPRMFQVRELIEEAKSYFPIIAKPKYRWVPIQAKDEINLYTLFKKLENNRMVILRNTEEVKKFVLSQKEMISHFLFQEYVSGYADRMYTIGVYANRDHDVLGVFTGKKVRGFPPDIGDCTIGQSEEMPTELVNMVKDIVKESRYHGIAEFEFKKDAQTEEFKLIEVNPRSWSWIGITPACGVSLPMIAYADLTGCTRMPYKYSKARSGEVKYVKLLEDLWNCSYANNKAGFPEYNLTLTRWWKSLYARQKIYAEFCWDDPAVALYSVMYQVTSLYSH